jgi:hypothetical protein
MRWRTRSMSLRIFVDLRLQQVEGHPELAEAWACGAECAEDALRLCVWPKGGGRDSNPAHNALQCTSDGRPGLWEG